MIERAAEVEQETKMAASLDVFLSELFPVGPFLELRALPSRAQGFFRPEDGHAIRGFLEQHHRENLFFGVAARREANDGSLQNCADLWALFSDIDFKTIPEGDARRRLAALPLPPSIVVHSGGGLHVYWFLRKAVDARRDAKRIKDILRRLAFTAGGDLSAAEPARILRVPGTLNRKYHPPRRVIIEQFEEHPYTLQNIEAAFPGEPAVEAPATLFRVPAELVEGVRNTTLYRLARSLHARRLSPAAILAALREENRATAHPPLNEDEVERIAAHAVAQPDRPDFQPRGAELGGGGGEHFTLSQPVSLEPLPPTDTWPHPDPAIFHGLAGDFVALIDPYTEADPVATLGHFLTAFGNVIGPGPHASVGYDRHPGRLNIAFVGPTSKGRKGTALSPVQYVFSQIAPDWRPRIKSGLSSGEGLIHHVRDQREETKPVKKDGEITYETVVVDPGESDKRLLVVEPEFAVVLKRMAGEGNSLSGVMRQAWDSGDLATLTKISPVQATGAHISVIAHITEEELRRYLTETERANGFGNRFIWLLVRRSKMLPDPDPMPTDQLDPLITDISAAVTLAQQVGEVRRTKMAAQNWAEVYPALSEGEPGLTGAILSRSEAHVLRLSTLYALLDGSKEVRVRHLKPALALWSYAEASARRIFGDRLGAPVADTILGALRSRGPMSETEISALFGRHRKAEELQAAYEFLEQKGRVQKYRKVTDGRPAVIWEAK